MNKIYTNIKQVISFIIMHAIFWFALFAIERLIFICINSNLAIEAHFGNLFSAMWHGMLFDASIIGYITILYCIIIALLSPWIRLSPIIRSLNVVTSVLASIITILLPADAIVYGHWEHHADATDFGMFSNPKQIFESVDNETIIIYIIACILLIFGTLSLQHTLTTKSRHKDNPTADTIINKIIQSFIILFIGGLMIIPIRGGFGIAPLNTGRAFFCDNLFANHTALNPVWNFMYSMKRLKEANTTYKFMDDEQAEQRFAELMTESNEYPIIIKNNRPNIVVILLESFSAHAIEYLGGENATPTIQKLLKSSVSFKNIMAASDRSGKGLVAAMCGYPVLPTLSIIQYPQKTQTLPFIAQKLRNNGYESQTFIYGGDLNFNNFNSLVTLAGFDKVITQNDFNSNQMSDKWGAHDEHSLNRLFDEMKNQKEPFFDFIFTLSSHEPFTVPMDRKIDDDYLNSVYYTDMCLGQFIDKLQKSELWDKTLVILMADHGHPGPSKVGVTDKKRFNIPLIFTGGILSKKDTIIEKYGTQIDLASTLLHQLDIDVKEFTFSKNLLDKGNKGFSFFDFNDGFGYVDESTYQVFDNQSQKYLRFDKYSTTPDTISGKAILQIMSNDNQKR